MMKVVCAWCGKVISEAEKGEDPDKVSHGLCPECVQINKLALEALKQDIQLLKNQEKDER